MQRRVQRTQKSQSQPKSKTEKVVREVGPRREEVIQTIRKKNEYMDNFSYHETKDLKRNNPRYFVVVEHTRKGDIFGDGNFEKTSYERQVYSQGGNRPKLDGNDRLRGKKPAQQTATQQITKKTTRTTTSNNSRKQNPVSATATNEKIQQTTMKRRNEGTVSKTESRTETKTTTSGVRGQNKESTTSKTTTKTSSQRPAGGKTQTTTTTTKTTRTTTTRTRGRV
jgi:hypothetical protein